MRWRGERQSTNIEDRRGMGGRGLAVGGGLGTLIIMILALVFGFDPQTLLQQAPTDQTTQVQTSRPQNGEEEELKQFVGVVLAKSEDVWQDVFRQNGRQYREPTLVLFTDQVRSACGIAGAAVGPFYCPNDEKVYIDLAFYRVLKERFHAPGDFAQAYVIAHEIGHHVQTLLGVSDKVQALKQQAMRSGDQPRANAYQVRMELQADCLAGVWASLNDQVKNRLQPGDVEAGLNAAAQIGDDTLQKRTQGQVVPESFTHGSSQQRVRWFKKGLESGRMQACDTFDGKEL